VWRVGVAVRFKLGDLPKPWSAGIDADTTFRELADTFYWE